MAPPRKPPRTIPWTAEKVEAVTQSHLASSVPGGVPGQVDLAASELADDSSAQVHHLARTAVYDYLSLWAARQADESAAAARDAGAAWADVAIATGYAEGASAARRFDPAQRAKRAAASARQRAPEHSGG